MPGSIHEADRQKMSASFLILFLIYILLMGFTGTDATKRTQKDAIKTKFVRTTRGYRLKPIPIQEIKGFEPNQTGYRKMLHEKKQ